MTAEEYDNFPQEIKNILNSYDDNESLYKECVRIKLELETIGWTCDYDLSGEVYDVKPESYTTCDRCSYDIKDEDGDILEHYCIDDELYAPK